MYIIRDFELDIYHNIFNSSCIYQQQTPANISDRTFLKPK
jgi:hypothetical protein